MEQQPKSSSSSGSSSGSDDSAPVTFTLAFIDPVGDKVEKRLLEIRKEIDEMTAEADTRANRPPASHSARDDGIYDLPTQVDPLPSQSKTDAKVIQDILDGNEDEITYDAHPDYLGDTVRPMPHHRKVQDWTLPNKKGPLHPQTVLPPQIRPI